MTHATKLNDELSELIVDCEHPVAGARVDLERFVLRNADAILSALRLAESHPSAIDIQPFGHETNEPWPGQQPTANALAEAIAEMATNDRWGLIQRVRAIIVRDRATVRARWEKHPSAIREAVEGEREAIADMADQYAMNIRSQICKVSESDTVNSIDASAKWNRATALEDFAFCVRARTKDEAND